MIINYHNTKVKNHRMVEPIKFKEFVAGNLINILL